MLRHMIAAGTMVVSTAHAAPYQQLPGHFGGFGSDGSTFVVADSFELDQSTYIGGLTWWGGYLNAPSGPDSFTVRFYSDGGGQPASVLQQFVLGAVSTAATGEFLNAPNLYPEFEYSTTFPMPFLVEAGTTYWLSIVNPPRDIWFWEASGSSAYPGVQRSFEGGPWEPFFDNTAFRVAPVPEPQSVVLMSLGLASLLSLFRRRMRTRNRGAA